MGPREKEQRRRGAAQSAGTPRQSALEKQVQKESKETAGLSEYERNRLKNIQERLAMFQKLGFNDLKDKLTGGKDGEKKEKCSTASKVEAREKSRRIQEKGAKGGKNTILSDIGATMGEEETECPDHSISIKAPSDVLCTGRPDRMLHRNLRETKQSQVKRSDKLLLSFPPFPARHPVRSHCIT